MLQKETNVVLTTCTVQNTSSYRGKNKGNILYYNHLFSLLVFSLWLKSLPTEDNVDFLPISHPGNARTPDYRPERSEPERDSGATGGQIDPQRWRSGKEMDLKGLLRNSSSYVTDRQTASEMKDE